MVVGDSSRQCNGKAGEDGNGYWKEGGGGRVVVSGVTGEDGDNY